MRMETKQRNAQTAGRTPWLFVAAALIAVWGWAIPATAENTTLIVRDGTLFKTQDTNRPWFYAGYNNYYIGIDNSSTAVVDELITDTKAMNLNVLRLWGFNDDQAKASHLQEQIGGTVYQRDGSEPGGSTDYFQMLDYTLHKANEAGIRVILPLTNNWGDYGGMQQYVDWNGGGSKDSFYTNAGAQNDYRAYLSYLANRANTYNGRTYKSDPTILAWELANEPRYATDTNVADGSNLTNWINNTADYLKDTLGVQQMVAVGMEGFYDTGNQNKGGESWMNNEGTDFLLQHADANIDFATFHLYQDHWGTTDAEAITWIMSHVQDARRDASVGKPVVMEEYGRTVPPNSTDQRNTSFRGYLERANRDMASGANFWILYHDTYTDYDNFGVYYPTDATTIAVIDNYARKVRLLNDTGVHQLHAFQYDTEDFQNDTYTERATINTVSQTATPSWALTGDGALCINVTMQGEGPSGEASKFTIGAREGIFEDPANPWGAGPDISDYGYQAFIGRVMADGMAGAGDLAAALFIKTGSWHYDDGGGAFWTTLLEDEWVELVLPLASLDGTTDLTDLKSFGLQIYANNSFNGNIYLDFVGGDLTNLSDNLAPEPGTLVLLALGGVGLLARRRRGK